MTAGEISLDGQITEENPHTAESIVRNLPIVGEAVRWGDEVYFITDVEIPEENGRQDVEVGEVAFWPAGKAIAVFFGRTPVSISDKPRAFENVNVFGKLDDDPSQLTRVESQDRIAIQGI